MTRGAVAHRFDWADQPPARLVCQARGCTDHVLHVYVDRAGQPSLLRGLYARGELTGRAEREAAELVGRPAV